MAVPAHKIAGQPTQTRQAHRRLAVVEPTMRKRARKCDPTTVARQNFRAFALLTALVCILGLGRVWLSVQAAEASLDAGQLRIEIKDARYRGDMLEVRQSALSSPSRIRAIAGATMDMAPAADVTYIDLSPVATARATQGDEGEPSALERVLSDALVLAAGEGQVLLVGDVALASAR